MTDYESYDSKNPCPCMMVIIRGCCLRLTLMILLTYGMYMSR